MGEHAVHAGAEEEAEVTGAARSSEPAGRVIAQGTPAQIAELLVQRPDLRDQLLRSLHTRRGNAFVQQVLASTGAAAKSDEPAVDDDASGKPGPSGSRFQGDGTLGAVERGAEDLKLGDSGRAVRKLQIALAELSFRPLDVTGVFDAQTEAQVQAYQTARKLARRDGVMDAATFIGLEKELNPEHYARVAGHAPPGMANNPKRQRPDPSSPLLAETHQLAPDEAAEANEIISTAKSGPPVGAFKESIGEGMEHMYGPRMLTILQARIDEAYGNAKATQKDHDKGNTFAMDHLVRLGNAAKQQVDAVFGSWATGPELKADINFRDRYTADRAEQAKLDPAGKVVEARSRARYLMSTNDEVDALDKEHSADRTRPAEAAIIKTVLDLLARDNTEKLLLITSTWSGSTDREGHIKLQRTKTHYGEDGDRDRLWRKFGTMIHEYLHSLVHPNWLDHRRDKRDTDPQGAHVLSEGVTEFLTRAVLTRLDLADPKLHQAVEGKHLHDSEGATPDLDRSGSYAKEYAQAHGLVGVVGAHNVYAAYFLGHMNLIGA